MASENAETIKAYDVSAQAYIERDTGRSRSDFYDQWLTKQLST